MRAHLHLADPLEVHAGGLGMPPAAVTVFWPFHRAEAMRRLEAGVPRSAARLHPPEERLERLVEPPQRGLLAGERPDPNIGTPRADPAELGGLAHVADRHRW